MSDGLRMVSCLLGVGSVEVLRSLSSELFVREEVQVYEFVQSHYRRYGRLPSVETVQQELGVRLPVAHEPPAFYLSKLRDRQYYNEIREQFGVLRDALRDTDMGAARGVVDRMRRLGREEHTNTDVRTVQEAWSGVYSSYQYAHSNPGVSGVPSGWRYFDEVSGGYQPGDLITWVARPSMGKTYVMLQQSYVAWQSGYNVLFVTTEMPIVQISRRFYSIASGVNPDYLRKGRLSNSALRRLTNMADSIVAGDRYRMYAAGMSSTVADVEMLMQEYLPDIVFIDGVYLMKPSPKRRQVGRFEAVAEVYDELAGLKLSSNRPIVASTQFSRQAGKKGKEGSLETIGYTDAIGTHSSIVAGVHEGTPPHTVDHRKIEIMKGREGEHGSFEIRYQFSPVDFSQVEAGDADTVAVDMDWMLPE